MRIFLHEITESETSLDFSQEDPWVLDAVLRVDENSSERTGLSPKRPISAHLSLRQVDGVIVVSGKIDTYIELICSRCAAPFRQNCKLGFSALFCTDPAMAGVAHLQHQHHRDAGRPVGQNQGFARHAHNREEDESDFIGKDLDITYLSHEYIDLCDVITEQLQIQVPFQPLCREACKGICFACGKDLNLDPCSCVRIEEKRPFSILRDLKI